jgi:hypothetical protein
VSHITSKQLRKLKSGEPLTGYAKEGDLVIACIRWLESVGCFVWKQNQGGAMKQNTGGKPRFVRFAHVKGISDIIGLTPEGVFIAVEVKQPKNKPTPDQDAFLERVRVKGGIAIVAHSVGELAAEYLSQTKGER